MRRASMFVTCIVDQLFPKVGMAMVEVLERIGYEVDFPRIRPAAASPHLTPVTGMKPATWHANS